MFIVQPPLAYQKGRVALVINLSPICPWLTYLLGTPSTILLSSEVEGDLTEIITLSPPLSQLLKKFQTSLGTYSPAPFKNIFYIILLLAQILSAIPCLQQPSAEKQLHLPLNNQFFIYFSPVYITLYNYRLSPPIKVCFVQT